MKQFPSPLARSMVAVALFGLGLASGLASDVRVGLVSYWPMNVDSGGFTPDAYWSNNLPNIGSSPLVAGHDGNAFSFNGSSQYLGLTHSTDNTQGGLPIYNPSGAYSVCLWVKAPPVGSGGNAADRYLFAEGSTASPTPLFLLQTRNGTTASFSNKLDVYVRTTAGGAAVNHLKSTNVVFDNTWHHIAWVDERGNAKLYVDGNLDANSFAYTPGAIALNTTAVGALIRSTVGGFFMGAIDEVATWERALSQAEVQQVMSSGIGATAIAPVIDQQPLGSTNRIGDYVKLSVSVYGSRPLSYQWLKNGSPLPDKTNAFLPITDLTGISSNAYSVVVTNVFGSLTSAEVPVVVSTADPAPDVTVGLVSYWPLDTVNITPSLTNTPDLYYRHSDMTLRLMDGASVQPGQVNSSLFFDGITQYGLRANGSCIYNVTNYSVAFWVNGGPTFQFNKQVFAEGATNQAFFLLGTENVANGGSSLNVKISTGMGDRKSSRPVFDGAWHHVVWVDENGKAKLYIDGLLDETDYNYTRTNLALENTSLGCLFRNSAANYFAGFLDEVATWNRRLTYTEIQQLQSSTVPPPSLIAPAITQQPLGSTNRLGDRSTLSVVATGSSPLTYQWSKNGSPLAGATDSAMALWLTSSGTNLYSVLVNNLAGSAPSSTITVAVLADGPADLGVNAFYYWPLEIVTGTNTPDLYSADPLALTAMEASPPSPGHIGNALTFDGISQFAQRLGGYPVYLTTNYTIAFWVNGAPGQFNKQVFAEGGVGGQYFLLGTENVSVGGGGLLNVKVNPGLNDRKSSRTVFDSSWHHVVWSDENGKARLYVDGVLDETEFSYTRTTNVLAMESTSLAALVRGGAANFFAGSIDEVGVWNRRLSWTEINQLYSTGIPASVPAVAPAIFAQPADKTNDVWATDVVRFSVLASGSGPLQFHWRKDGQDLSSALNPSATNSVLSFSSVATADAGAYSVVVANSAGSVTSTVAQLTVVPYVPVTSGDALKLDFDKAGSPGLQPGFTSMSLDMSGTNVAGPRVTISVIGAVTLLDRNRAEGGIMVVDNPPLLTQAGLYNDFFYANSGVDGRGMRFLIERLAHNTQYALTLWSFDAQSTGVRYSDWIETSSGSTHVIQNGYTFDGSVLPTSDYDNTLGGLVTSTATGTLQIEARKNGGSTTVPGVFINALRLVANPVVRISVAQVVNGNLRLVAEGAYPGQPLRFEERSSVSSGAWATPAAGGIISTNPLRAMAEFPLTGSAFYRAVSP